MNRGFIGLENYQRLWEDEQFRNAVLVTVKLAVISVFFKFWIGLAASLLLNRLLRWRGLLTALVLLPWIVPEVVAAMTWRGLYDPTFGGFNSVLIAAGVLKKGLPLLGDYHRICDHQPAQVIDQVWPWTGSCPCRNGGTRRSALGGVQLDRRRVLYLVFASYSIVI